MKIFALWSEKFVESVLCEMRSLYTLGNEDLRYNEQQLKARQNYSKICGSKLRNNEPRYNE